MAIGTSDGEYYPSKLEEVLASLDAQGSTTGDRNIKMDGFRKENDTDQFGPGQEPLSPVLPGINDKSKNDQNPQQRILRVENESPSLDNVLKQLDQQTQPPASASPTQEDFDRLMQQPRAKDSHSPSITPTEPLNIVPKPGNARLTQASLIKLTGKDASGQEITITPQSFYQRATDALDNLSDMKGAEKWSPKELAGYALSMAMNAFGVNKAPINSAPGEPFRMSEINAPNTFLGVSEAQPRSFNPSNDNFLNDVQQYAQQHLKGWKDLTDRIKS
jgi:hypothetical protein